MIKIFGIGNILLGDDGIGVYVLEKIKNSILDLNENIKVIMGETDYIYCLNEIKNEDMIVIIDSISTNKSLGDISLFNIKECEKFLSHNITSHEVNLINALMYEHINIKGYLIAIEIKEIDYSLELSTSLKKKLSDICNEVLSIISELINNIQG